MCISHVWRASSRSDIKAGEVDFQSFFRGAENGPERASNGRVGPPFSRLERGLRVLFVRAFYFVEVPYWT